MNREGSQQTCCPSRPSRVRGGSVREPSSGGHPGLDPIGGRTQLMRAPLYSSNPSELFEPGTIANPQTLYARLRSETPLARVADTGVHLVATWGLIEEALAREYQLSAN